MINKVYDKQSDAGRLSSEIIASGKLQYPNAGFKFYGVNSYIEEGNWKTEVMFIDSLTTDEIIAIDNLVANTLPVPLPEDSQFLKDNSGKLYVRAESRPIDCTTYFTSCGDVVGATPIIGGGNRLQWDASVDTFFTEGVPTGFKRKYLDIGFCDSVWIKEGTIYGIGVSKGSYLDLQLICPPSGYFMYFGTVMQNTSNDWLVVDHYVMKHPIQGDCPMGDELNTETCSQEMLSYFNLRFVVTIPVNDVTSYGYMELEVFRQRTVVL